MKTAVSIPDRVFESAEQLAERLQVSRSDLYCKALSAFIEIHRDDMVKEQLNAVYGSARKDSQLEAEIASLQAHAIGREKW